jgi:hypothetical protein
LVLACFNSSEPVPPTKLFGRSQCVSFSQKTVLTSRGPTLVRKARRDGRNTRDQKNDPA